LQNPEEALVLLTNLKNIASSKLNNNNINNNINKRIFVANSQTPDNFTIFFFNSESFADFEKFLNEIKVKFNIQQYSKITLFLAEINVEIKKASQLSNNDKIIVHF
jgi:hypothetical protein